VLGAIIKPFQPLTMLPQLNPLVTAYGGDVKLYKLAIVTNGSQRVPFPNNNVLQDKCIVGITSYDDTDVPTDAASGLANVPLASYNSAQVTLKDNNNLNIVDGMPLVSTNTIRNNGWIKQFSKIKLSFQSCFIDFDAASIPVANKVVILEFAYIIPTPTRN
jgi:hypothetical protein